VRYYHFGARDTKLGDETKLSSYLLLTQTSRMEVAAINYRKLE